MDKNSDMIKNGEIIHDFDKIKEVYHQVKNLNCGLITNFFLDTLKHGIWINQQKFKLVWESNTAFLIYLEDGFYRLFYISPDFIELETSINAFIRENSVEKFVIDLVGLEINLKQLLVIFNKEGFKSRSSLVRMSSVVRTKPVFVDSSIIYANNTYLNIVESLLHEYFDKFVEQIPSEEELFHWIENKQVVFYKNGNNIGGFLIYQNMVNTAYLRYWFVHPDFRNQKIGSKLINKFFSENSEAKRFLFWVIESNENAIKRYLHYGFKPERLKDIVLTFNI